MDEREKEVQIIELVKTVNKLKETVEAMNLSHSIFRKSMNFIRKHQKYIRLMIDILVVMGAILSFFKL